MRKIVALLFVLSSSFAYAGQSIVCKQTNKDGSFTKNGIKLKLQLEFNRNGEVNNKSTIKVRGFKQNGVEPLSALSIKSVNQSQSDAAVQYTTFFFADNLDGLLDIQLQFNKGILNESLRQEPARFVIGSEDANPETSFAFGYDMACNSYLK